MTKWIIIIAVVLVVGVGVATRLGGTVEPIDAATAQRGTMSAYVEERARTRLPQTWRITMPFDGRILPVEVTVGQAVRAGETVARLELADLETAVARAEAEVERLRASIAESNDERLERSTIVSLDSFLESLDRTVEAAQAQTESSRAREDFRATDLKRKEHAFADAAATQKELEDAQLAAIETRIQYRTDILSLRALEAIRRAAQIGPRTVQQSIEKKGLTEAVLMHQLAGAREDLEQSRRDRARASLVSPVDGVVLARHVTSEQVLAAGAHVLEIGHLPDLEIEADVLTEDAVDMTVGDPVDVFGPSIGTTSVTGTVRRVEPQGFTKISSLGVEQQRVRVIVAFDDDARARLESEGRTLGVGYRVRVRIHTDRAENAVIVPRTALFRGTADEWQVFVVDGGRARQRDVVIGLANEREIEVREGIAEGETVILAPESGLEDGDRVEER